MYISKRVDYLVALINEFGRKFSLSDREAYLYLQKYGAIAIYDDCYEYLHTQSFDCATQELAQFCQRNGGSVA